MDVIHIAKDLINSVLLALLLLLLLFLLLLLLLCCCYCFCDSDIFGCSISLRYRSCFLDNLLMRQSGRSGNWSADNDDGETS